jgi:hypothetical protein
MARLLTAKGSVSLTTSRYLTPIIMTEISMAVCISNLRKKKFILQKYRKMFRNK